MYDVFLLAIIFCVQQTDGNIVSSVTRVQQIGTRY